MFVHDGRFVVHVTGAESLPRPSMLCCEPVKTRRGWTFFRYAGRDEVKSRLNSERIG